MGVNAMSGRTKRLGYRGVRIMATPYRKDKALCSPTGALEKKRMLSEELILPDGQRLIYSRLGGVRRVLRQARI